MYSAHSQVAKEELLLAGCFFSFHSFRAVAGDKLGSDNLRNCPGHTDYIDDFAGRDKKVLKHFMNRWYS